MKKLIRELEKQNKQTGWRSTVLEGEVDHKNEVLQQLVIMQKEHAEEQAMMVDLNRSLRARIISIKEHSMYHYYTSRPTVSLSSGYISRPLMPKSCVWFVRFDKHNN